MHEAPETAVFLCLMERSLSMNIYIYIYMCVCVCMFMYTHCILYMYIERLGAGGEGGNRDEMIGWHH